MNGRREMDEERGHCEGAPEMVTVVVMTMMMVMMMTGFLRSGKVK